MKKVLVVSYYFPPINMMAAKRYGTMCRYFEKNGYEPYVITTEHIRSKGLDVKMELEHTLDESHVIRIGRTNKNNVVKSFYGKWLLNILQRGRYISRTFTEGSFGWYEKVKENIDLEKLHNIDIIIGTFPPMENLFVAYYLAQKLKIPYIADIRDLISDYTETGDGYRSAEKVDRIVERYILSKAGGIITVTPGFRKILKARFLNQKFKVVFNGWDRDGRAGNGLLPVCQLDSDGNKDKYLYYAGSLYLHRLESFKLLVQCIKIANKKKNDKLFFIVRSIGPKELDARAKNIVRQEGMQEYVKILEADSERVVRIEQKKAYINVVLSSIHVNDKALMTTIPGKVYELMNEKAPVLAVVPKASDIEKVLKYTNKGIASVNKEEVVDYLMEEHKRYTGNKKILDFSREKQAERLCSFLDEVLDV